MSPIYNHMTTYILRKREQYSELPEKDKEKIRLAIGLVAVGCFAYWNATVPLLSQASRRRKRRTVWSALKMGNIVAVLEPWIQDDSVAISDINFYGRFFTRPGISPRQVGSYWDSISKDWEHTFRSLKGVCINGKRYPVPRGILHGLKTGTMRVSKRDIICLTDSAPPHPIEEYGDLNVCLPSQSGVRNRHRKGSSTEELADKPKNMGDMTKPVSMYVQAGAHHSARIRTHDSSKSGFDMSNFHVDKTTASADKKYLQVKFAEATRQHFAFKGSAPNAQQYDNLREVADKMKVLVQTSPYARQEQLEPVREVDVEDDIGY